MSGDPCTEMQLLLQADLDGELSPTESARVAAHVSLCASCAALSEQLGQLSRRIRQDATRHPAPPTLRRRVSPGRRWRALVPAGMGVAVAAGLALMLWLPHGLSYEDELMASHIRALQPGHLLDVTSSDQHTVKPWFSGKLDFAPTVRDLAAEGFPLVGGRLDYVGGRTVAVLVYQRRQHVIDVYVWPAAQARLSDRHKQGFTIEAWSEGGLAYRAISDLDPVELGQFVGLLRAR